MASLPRGCDNNFNFLRLWLALTVIFSHSPELIDGDRRREPLMRLFHIYSLGDIAVASFFILSGFLIVQSWQRTPNWQSFLKNRVLRIYPAFIVASLFSAVVVGPLGSQVAPYFANLRVLALLKSLLFLQPPLLPPVFVGRPLADVNIPLWTIAYEFRCYCLVALFGACGLFKHRAPWLIFSGFVFVLCRVPILRDAQFFGSEIVWGNSSIFNHLLPYFCVGGCFFLCLDKIVFKPFWLVVALLMVLCSFAKTRIPGLFLNLLWPYVLLFFAFANIPVLKRFKTAPDVSYGLYLYGWPLQKLLLWYLPIFSPWLLFLVASGAAWACGLASWKVIERPFLRLKTA